MFNLFETGQAASGALGAIGGGPPLDDGLPARIQYLQTQPLGSVNDFATRPTSAIVSAL